MDESSITQNRRSRRSPVLLSATVEFLGRELPVVLRNLSSQGALIEGGQLPPEGALTTFRRKDLVVTGQIVRAEGRYAGLAFDRDLERDELLRHVPKRRDRIEPQFRRPGLASRPLSEAERQLVQLWATPVPYRES